ncbi:MAG: hypothetical protein ABFS24_09695 [Pseudomonadota bacterium]
MKRLFVILLSIAGLLTPPVFAEAQLFFCSDRVSADEDPKPGEEEEEPDCD